MCRCRAPSRWRNCPRNALRPALWECTLRSKRLRALKIELVQTICTEDLIELELPEPCGRFSPIVVIILAILGAAGYFGYQQVQKRQAAQKPDYESVTVDRGDISATVSAQRCALPSAVSLGFSATGTIATVDAEVGQQVGEGQVLAALDTTDLESSWQCARPRSGWHRRRRSCASCRRNRTRRTWLRRRLRWTAPRAA